MKRIFLLAGIAIGIVTGSKLGRQPYEWVQKNLRTIGARPEVRRVKETMAGAASDLGDTAVERIEEVRGKVHAEMSA
jgi:hypothetical protein